MAEGEALGEELALGRSWLRMMEEPQDSLEGQRDLGGVEVEEVRLRMDRREAERPSPDEPEKEVKKDEGKVRREEKKVNRLQME